MTARGAERGEPGIPAGADALDLFLGESRAVADLRAAVRRLLVRARGGAQLPAVLILGETGSGKGFLARLLHRMSPRGAGPLVDVNCAGLPEGLLESELFGHERGAFTGAAGARAGLFQAAHRGTLFLDEIGLLGPALQAKLLKAVEERAVRRLGSNRAEAVDTWIVSATNEDLGAAVRQRRFREDLYHRLAVVTLVLPPLRERGEDAVRLARHFLARAVADYRLEPLALSEAAEAVIRAHRWPGNVRQLANAVERAALLTETPVLGPEQLGVDEGPPPGPVSRPAGPADPGGPPPPPEGELRERLQQALDRHHGNVSRAADALGLARHTLRTHVRRLGLHTGAAGVAGAGLAPGPPGGREAAARAVDAEETSARPPGPAPAPASPAPEPSPARRPEWAGLRWERRLLTFWAVALSPPEGVPAFQLASTLEMLATTLERFGGRVEALRPRVLIGSFGADPVEDGPRRAAAAALASAKALERTSGPAIGRWAIEVAERLVTLGGPVTGMEPAEQAATWAALDTLLTAAAPGEIALGAGAVPHLDRQFDVTTGGGPPGAPVPALRPGGRARLAGPGRRPTPLVGRDRELAVLHDLLGRAEAGQGQLLGVVGDAGVGKSRLLQEFRASIDPGRVTSLVAHCPSHGATIPYGPLIELLRGAFQLGEDQDRETLQARFEVGLQAAGLNPAEGVPCLLHLFGWTPEPATLAGRSPEAILARTLDLVRALLVTGSRQRPLVCVIEDLQWADDSSVQALSVLADSLGAAAILLVATYRPGYRMPWLDRSYAHQLVVPRLGPEESQQVLDALVPAGRLEPGLRGHLVAQAGGIPFYLEELARMTVEWGEARPAGEIPPTVHAVVAARLDRLTPARRDLLQTAAVIGQEFASPVLAAAVGRSPAELGPDLAGLEAAEFVFPAGTPPPGTYRFRHGLTQEIAYRTILLERRPELHGRVADALERVAPEVRERQPEILARHHTEARRPVAAIRAWQRAGQLALARSAHVEAHTHLAEALALLPGLDPGPERVRQEVQILLGLGTALTARHGYAAPEVVPSLERAQALADQLGETVDLWPVRWALWRFSLSRADYRRGQALAGQLLDTAARADDDDLRLGAHLAAGVTAFYQGRFPAARDHLGRAAALDGPERSARQIATHGQDLGPLARAFGAWEQAVTGDPAGATASAAVALARARATAHPFSLGLTLYLVAIIHQLRGDTGPLQALGAELRRLADVHGYRLLTAFGLMVSGWAERGAGETDRAVGLIREGAELFQAVGQRAGLSHRGLLAEALLAGGRETEALDVLAGALDQADATGEAAFTAELCRLRGRALARGGRTDEAAAAWRRSLELALDQGALLFAVRALVDALTLGTGADRAEDRARLAALVARLPAYPPVPDLARARDVLGAWPPQADRPREGGLR